MTSGKEIVRLGQRLRSESAPTGDDLSALADYRREHMFSFWETMQLISELRVAQDFFFSGRLKNTSTIIEKLVREPGMTLRTMHDIAGIRLVLAGEGQHFVSSQKEIASVIERSGIFDEVSVKEKLQPKAATGGYRALHVHGKRAKKWVEVQIRTATQHRWAQLYERFADVFGRQIRYGHPPDSGGTVDMAGAEITRSYVLNQFFQLSFTIGIAEQNELPELIKRVNDEIDIFGQVLNSMPSVKSVVGSMPILNVEHGQAGLILIVYDRRNAQRRKVIEGQAEDMFQEWRVLDRQAECDSNLETVMLLSPSRQSLEVTHGRYFSAFPGVESMR